jgi:hypothetical protein
MRRLPSLFTSTVLPPIEQWTTSSCIPKVCQLVESLKSLCFVAFWILVLLARADLGRHTFYKAGEIDHGFPWDAVSSRDVSIVPHCNAW